MGGCRPKPQHRAADTISKFGRMKCRQDHKIVRAGKALIGIAGNYPDALDFIEWWTTGANRNNLPQYREYAGDSGIVDFEVLVAQPGKLTHWSQYFQPDEIRADFWSIGSGDQAAMGAMHMGADAAEAVRIAALVDFGTNGDVQVERLDGD